MKRTSLAALPLLLSAYACQVPGADELAMRGGADSRADFGSTMDHAFEAGAITPTYIDPNAGISTLDTSFPIPQIAGDGPNRVRFKAGAFFPSGDLHDLDTGFYGEFAYAHRIVPALAIETTVGYLETDGQDMGIDAKLWAIPLFANGRVQFDLWVLELYGGAGLGGLYVDYEAAGMGDTDFVGAWDAFLGLEVGLGGLRIGAEAKYLETEDTKDNFAVEGASALLTLSVNF